MLNFLLTCSADLPAHIPYHSISFHIVMIVMVMMIIFSVALTGSLIYIIYHCEYDDDDDDDDDRWQNVRCRRSVMIIPNCLRRGQ